MIRHPIFDFGASWQDFRVLRIRLHGLGLLIFFLQTLISWKLRKNLAVPRVNGGIAGF
jgi:hypothetical protein